MWKSPTNNHGLWWYLVFTGDAISVSNLWFLLRSQTSFHPDPTSPADLWTGRIELWSHGSSAVQDRITHIHKGSSWALLKLEVTIEWLHLKWFCLEVLIKPLSPLRLWGSSGKKQGEISPCQFATLLILHTGSTSEPKRLWKQFCHAWCKWDSAPKRDQFWWAGGNFHVYGIGDKITSPGWQMVLRCAKS